MSSPETAILALAPLACAIIFVTFKIAYGCGYRQGQCDAARRLSAFQRLKTLERSGYEHGRN